MISVTKYLDRLNERNSMRIIISADQNHIDAFMPQILEEAKKATVGRQPAYKHQPHFHGGEYHGHSHLANGCQVSWTVTGKRLHPNKFPADNKIPKNAKNAVAKVLGISPDILEGYIAYDEIEDEDVILFELKGKSKAAILLEKINSLLNSKND